ncbi:MAG: hypothetical protein AUG51_14485 [Acidobacteria bacterium 13_1_20CM_3_53_8]|nr:MAG: hypothetical protein AUG51_14485 [Acidobacteria bacterium 13_1_20CM_3_53_8]
MARKRFLKITLKILITLSLICGVAATVVIYAMKSRDEEHARFFNTGKSINSFLSLYKHGIEEAFRKNDTSEITSFYSESYRSPARGRWVMQPAPAENDVTVFKLVAEGQEEYDRNALDRELSGYLRNIASIQNIWCKIDMIEKVELERSVVVRVKYILDGTDAQGAIFQDRHFYRWHLVNEAAPGAPFNWKIIQDELIEGLRVEGNARGFIDVEPSSVGIDFKHSRDPKLNAAKYSAQMKFDIIEHGSGGVSVVDYNNDDRPDIFFPDGVRSRLYKNISDSRTGEVRFLDVTSEAGLDGIDQANAGIFADVDNDGFSDLFVARYLAPNKFFHNNGDGTFTDLSAKMGLDFASTSVTACFLDYNHDGFVDLYIGLYGDAIHDIPRLPFFAQNAPPNRLFRNDSGRGFTDVTEASGTGDVGWTLAVAAADYDRDGLPDIAVANDFGRKSLFHNNGDGTFTEVAKQAGVLDFSGGMGLVFGDFNDDGLPDLYTSNINSNQRWFGEDMTVSQYVRNVARTKWLLLDAAEYKKFYDLVGSKWVDIGRDIGEGNSLFRNNGDGTFSELKNSHTNRAGWSWSVAFFDMDNDTDLDIYAANGWISGKAGPSADL